VKEATELDEKGIDMVVAQGVEAGGHRGSFQEEDAPPLIGSMSLIPLVAGSVKRPVIAAGGIMSGRCIRAALLLGAAGVQAGTAFIGSTESLAIPSYKRALQNTAEREIVLTRSFSGRWARGIRNKLMTEVENSGIPIPVYPAQNSLTRPIRAAAQKRDNKEFTTLFAGQSASMARASSSSEIFKALVRESEMI
jgi:nitronate monooxygenase